ncbi:MAG: hypothetical protein OXC08_12120 [Thiotrichales bacterium]|nr:hypothetical protein [Thiotrichales bacterium]
MSMYPVAISTTKTDIAHAMSLAEPFVKNTDNPLRTGRGRVRLYNGDSSRSIYLLMQDSAPGDDSPKPVRVRAQNWFDLEIDVRANGGCWAWAGGDVTATALVTAWS